MIRHMQPGANFPFGYSFSAKNLFHDLPNRALQSLNDVTQEEYYEKGATVFLAGETASGIFTLVKGESQLILIDKLTNQSLSRQIKRHEIFGLPETLANVPFGIDLRTTAACSFKFISKESLTHLLTDEPDVCFRLLRLLGSKCQESWGQVSLLLGQRPLAM